jgi:dTDP-4-dehydrorhamnose 3,5-epimerase
MIFNALELAGAFRIEPQRFEDERGFFARAWCQREFAARGLNTTIAQCSISFNQRRGTLRGLHYQEAPCHEDKLVRCTRGALFDVLLDLRPGSPTFGRHVAEVLTPDNGYLLYVPKGFAHGFITLEDYTEVAYQISEFHCPEHARGVRWNDPAFGIAWPLEVTVISERDRNYPDFDPPSTPHSHFLRACPASKPAHRE